MYTKRRVLLSRATRRANSASSKTDEGWKKKERRGRAPSSFHVNEREREREKKGD